MEISIKVTIDLSDRLIGFINRLMPQPEATPERVVTKEHEKTETRKPEESKIEKTETRKPEEIKTEKAETRKQENTAETDVPNDSDKSTPTRTFEEIKTLFTEKVKAGKSAEIQAVLKQFGFAKLSEMTPEYYDRAYNLVKEVPLK